MAIVMSSRAKWLFGILGAIIVGAIGSGIWDLLFKPLFSVVGRLLLSVGTFGISSISQSIYEDVAKGFRESPSLEVEAMLMGTISGFILISLLGPWAKSKLVERFAEKPDSQNLSSGKAMIRSLTIVIIMIIVFFFGRLLQATYVNMAIVHYNQSLRICRPYVNQEFELQIDSRFAAIESKSDYAAVIRSLDSVAASNNVALREFTIW
ncbi:MAG: hypothetical protein IPH75_10365 [bacterium]|nr:hypothetical protein [bacterium]